MRILVFGSTGQVGNELKRTLGLLGEVIATTRSDSVLCGNLLDADGIARTIQTVSPELIVNAAAYTAVDRAEREPDLARAVNTAAPASMARAARQCGALLIHYSTDYVFNGTGTRPWRETDAPAPLNVYGKTKLNGEEAISASGCHHVILRTSWVYAAEGRNFPLAILERARTQEELTIVDDQFGAPTGAELIADVTGRVARSVLQHENPSSLEGIYHVAPSGETSWYAFGQFVVDYARRAGTKLKVKRIRPVSSSQFKTDAVRPRNSRLDTSKVQTNFGIQLPRWEHGVERMLDRVISAENRGAA